MPRVNVRSPASRPMRQRRMRWRSCSSSNSVSVASADGAVGLALGLLDDDFEFARQLAGVDQRVRVRVGLDREARGEPARREHRVVVRVIVDRAGVEIAAARLGVARDLAGPARRRALEVHVLEHVRDADLGVGLVEVAGLHVRDDRDHRRARVAAHEQAQAVRERRAHAPIPAGAPSRAGRRGDGRVIARAGGGGGRTRPSTAAPAP